MTDVPDVERLVRRLGGNRDLLREIAAMFVSGAPGMMREVAEAVERGDAPLLRQAAHKLKGSAANFLATGAVEAALRLERMGAAGNLSGAREACEALGVEVMRLRESLSGLCAEPEPGTEEESR